MSGQVVDLERERLRRQGKPVPPGGFTHSELHRACLALGRLSLVEKLTLPPTEQPAPPWVVRTWRAMWSKLITETR